MTGHELIRVHVTPAVRQAVEAEARARDWSLSRTVSHALAQWLGERPNGKEA